MQPTLRVEMVDHRHHLGTPVQSEAMDTLGVELPRDLPGSGNGDEIPIGSLKVT